MTHSEIQTLIIDTIVEENMRSVEMKEKHGIHFSLIEYTVDRADGIFIYSTDFDVFALPIALYPLLLRFNIVLVCSSRYVVPGAKPGKAVPGFYLSWL